MSTEIIEKGEKYGMIVFPDLFVDDDVIYEMQLTQDLWFMRGAPFALTENLKGGIGSIKVSQMEGASLFLIAKGPSQFPDDLDWDNERLKKRVYHFYLGILISGFVTCHTQPYILTGANRDGKIDVRQMGDYRIPHTVPGAPPESVNSLRLANAAKLADRIGEISDKNKYHRIIRGIRAFIRGFEEYNAGDRMHQFTRCTESFIYPKIGKTRDNFISRSRLFLKTPHNELMGEIFDIRSSVEHIHDPLRSIAGESERRRRILLLQRATEAEAIARYCLSTLLIRRELWEYFENDNQISAFWKLNEGRRRELWGEPLDIDLLWNNFDADSVEDECLGL
jgi:hypothetical protein